MLALLHYGVHAIIFSSYISKHSSVMKSSYKNKPDTAWKLLVEELNSSTFFLVGRPGPTIFNVSDENKNTFKIMLGNPHSCSCGSKYLCLHAIFCLIKVLRIPTSHPMCWQTSFTDSDVDMVLNFNFGRKEPKKPRNVLKSKRGSSSSTPRSGADDSVVEEASNRQALSADGDDVCPICQDDMLESQPLTWCRNGCGNNIHAKCMRMYVMHRRSKYITAPSGGVECPLCRSNWALEYLDQDCKEKPAKSMKNIARIRCSGCSETLTSGYFCRCVECSQAALLYAIGNRSSTVDYCSLCVDISSITHVTKSTNSGKSENHLQAHTSHHLVVGEVVVASAGNNTWQLFVPQIRSPQPQFGNSPSMRTIRNRSGWENNVLGDASGVGASSAATRLSVEMMVKLLIQTVFPQLSSAVLPVIGPSNSVGHRPPRPPLARGSNVGAGAAASSSSAYMPVNTAVASSLCTVCNSNATVNGKSTGVKTSEVLLQFPHCVHCVHSHCLFRFVSSRLCDEDGHIASLATAGDTPSTMKTAIASDTSASPLLIALGSISCPCNDCNALLFPCFDRRKRKKRIVEKPGDKESNASSKSNGHTPDLSLDGCLVTSFSSGTLIDRVQGHKTGPKLCKARLTNGGPKVRSSQREGEDLGLTSTGISMMNRSSSIPIMNDDDGDDAAEGSVLLVHRRPMSDSPDVDPSHDPSPCMTPNSLPITPIPAQSIPSSAPSRLHSTESGIATSDSLTLAVGNDDAVNTISDSPARRRKAMRCALRKGPPRVMGKTNIQAHPVTGSSSRSADNFQIHGNVLSGKQPGGLTSLPRLPSITGADAGDIKVKSREGSGGSGVAINSHRRAVRRSKLKDHSDSEPDSDNLTNKPLVQLVLDVCGSGLSADTKDPLISAKHSPSNKLSPERSQKKTKARVRKGVAGLAAPVIEKSVPEKT